MIPQLSSLSRKIIFVSLALLCLTPWISPPFALILGLLVAQFTGHPFLAYNRKATSLLLKISVVGLGFGMNFHTALQAGSQGFIFTLVSIAGTLVLGFLLARIMKFLIQYS